MKSLSGALVRGLLLTFIGVTAALAAKEKPPVQYQIAIPAPPDFSDFDWLQGQWTGKTVGNSPPGEVQLSVGTELDKHFLMLRGRISLAATATVPATKESWLGVLSVLPHGGGFIASVYSSTGFVSRYRVTVEQPEVRLTPEGGESPPPGWLFRIIWARTGPQEITQTVQVAPPGKAFFDYYTAKLDRPVPSPKPAPSPEPSK